MEKNYEDLVDQFGSIFSFLCFPESMPVLLNLLVQVKFA